MRINTDATCLAMLHCLTGHAGVRLVDRIGGMFAETDAWRGTKGY
jgi:hypothetical protein